jgi:hypothetical protein
MNSKIKVTIGNACIEIEGSSELVHTLFNESIERLNQATAKKTAAKSEDQEAKSEDMKCEDSKFEENNVCDENSEISEEWSSIEGIIIQNREKAEEEY